MITSGFATPLALLLLLPVALLPLQGRLTGRNQLLAPRLGDVVGGRSIRSMLAWVPLALRMLGLALLVVALARPQRSRTDVVVESEGLDIILAIDTSCSMQEQDMGGLDRLEAAKTVSKSFIERRPNDRIGVVAFGSEAFTQCPLTLDHDTLRELVDAMVIGVAGPNGTAVGTAIAVSAKRLKDLEAPSKIVVLVTDGQSNAGRIAPIEAARAAAALGIRIYTIGIGAQGRPSLLGRESGPDEEGLTAIAEATGGRYFRATNPEKLQDVYGDIDELEPSPAEVRQLVEHEELFRIPLVPGLFLLILDLLLAATWLRRGP